MDKKIYLLTGKARSGKDTVFNIIKDYYESKEKKVVQVTYKKYIKDIIFTLTGWDGSEETKPRDLLQYIGADLIRKQVNKNFFTTRIIDDIKIYCHFFDIVIISDARFIDEIEVPKKEFKNVKTIKIERPNFKNELTEKQKKHITEIALDNYHNYDYVVQNNGVIEELKAKIIKIIEEVENGS